MDIKELLFKAFEAGEIYNGNLEFGEYAEPFKEWYDNLDKSLLPVVSRSIGLDTENNFGVIKTSETKHPNICIICKYKGNCNKEVFTFCKDKLKINQYYG